MQVLSTKQKNVMEPDGIVLSVKNLLHCFGDRTVLSIDDWSVAGGDHCLIEGPSGSGKSTLLHLIAGLMPPVRGEIVIRGQKVSKLSGHMLDQLRGEAIGIVLQNFHLIEALDVLGNLRLAQSLAGVKPDVSLALSLLDRVGMATLARKKPAMLSQGERQRVAIIRAVINRPALLLADEPTSALDDHHAKGVLELLISEADAAGATLLMASHDSRAKSRLPVGLRLGEKT